jgi:hypothetical protein
MRVKLKQMARKTHRRRRGGDGFSGMSAKQADEYVAKLSKEKTKKELQRLSSAAHSENPIKEYEGVGQASRTPSPLPTEQWASTERARSTSAGRRRRHSKRKTHRRRR